MLNRLICIFDREHKWNNSIPYETATCLRCGKQKDNGGAL